MDVILSFLRNNWKLIGFLVVLTIYFIIALCKKKVKVSELAGLLLVLPDFIKEAEASMMTGSAKFTMVFSKSIKYLTSLTGLPEQEVINKYADVLNSAIENILSTPKKKEVN